MPLSNTARNTAVVALTDTFTTLQFAADNTFSPILATITFAGFGTATAGARSANAIAPSTVANTGNIEAWRVRDSGNVTLIDETGALAVTGTGGGGIVVLNQATTAVTAGQTLTIDTFTVTVPA